MENQPGIWVEVRADGKWEVRHPGGRGILGVWDRRDEAIIAARDYAQTVNGVLMVQGLNGQFQQVDVSGKKGKR